MGEVADFFYQGPISASKSLMNRALIIQSFYPDLKIIGESRCQDVLALKNALLLFKSSQPNPIFDCGAAGTVLRFLLTRLSRERGEFVLTGDERLFNRPHHPLLKALEQLGVQCFLENKNELKIVSTGWNVPSQIDLDLSVSSQFISSLLLSAWNLPEKLVIHVGDQKNSLAYLEMTIAFLRNLGMEIQVEDEKLIVPQDQKLKSKWIQVEPDMSSAFAVAAFAAFKGELILENFPKESLQPDFVFIDLLQKMGVSLDDCEDNKLKIKSASQLKPIDFNFSNQPDLFPVLAILLSRAEGTSTLTGLKLLNFKESKRLDNIQELLSALGIENARTHDKLMVRGKKNHVYPNFISFDPDHDHRMAMAAALAKYQGAPIEIQSPNVVEKSFPEFWEIIGHA